MPLVAVAPPADQPQRRCGPDQLLEPRSEGTASPTAFVLRPLEQEGDRVRMLAPDLAGGALQAHLGLVLLRARVPSGYRSAVARPQSTYSLPGGRATNKASPDPNWYDTSTHTYLYGGQVNYMPNVNNEESRLIAGGLEIRDLYADQISNPRFVSTLVTGR